jgi:putative copper export protein
MLKALSHGLITFADLAALSTLIGAAWCSLWTADEDRTSVVFRVWSARLFRLIGTSLSAVFITSVFSLVQRSSEMSGLGSLAVLPMLPSIFLKTHYGTMWLARFAAILMALTALGTRKIHDNWRVTAVILFLSGAVISFARSASGHASDFGDLSPQQVADWLHLLSVSSIVGTIIVAAFVFSPSSVCEDDSVKRLTSSISLRFYKLFGPALAIIAATGLYNSWFEIRSFEAIANTAYGRIFVLKLLILLLLVLRYIAPPEPRGDEVQFSQKFLRHVRVDAVIVLAALLSVSLLVHKIPAKHQLHLEQIEHAAAEKSFQDSLPEPVIILEANPSPIPAGRPVELTLSLREKDGTPLRGLELSHERIVHAIFIGKDLQFFSHIHPEDDGPLNDDMIKGGTFPLHLTFPRAGKYLVGIDFARDGRSYSWTIPLTVLHSPDMEAPKVDLSSKRGFDNKYEVSVSTSPVKALKGVETTLTFIINKDGKPVSDLEPYLGAAMHLAVVSADLDLFIHAHGTPPGEHHSDHAHAAPARHRFGPDIEAEVVFPVKGVYKIFTQVRHQGRVLLFDFMIDVQ